MSRSGYSDYCCDDTLLNLYRGAVDRAFAGKRGQAFLKEVLSAMDAMPEKRLIAGGMIVTEAVAADEKVGDCCAIGAAAKARGLDMKDIDHLIETGDDEEIGRLVGKRVGIAESMAREIMYVNDEYGRPNETPEERFVRMRKWIERQIQKEPQ